MRIIHTSDWHLGQNFMGKSRAPEHQAFFAWLLEQITQHKVDALIVAGDVFDTGSPPSYAREMYNRFVVDIHTIGCQLIVLAGNHDSVATLNESKDLLGCLGATVVSCIVTDENQQALIEIKNKKDEVSAILCAVPFIRPRDVITSLAGQSIQEKQQALQKGISDYYHMLYQQALKRQKKYKTTHKKLLPIIATGHLTTVGASTSESVREIYIGTLDAFPASGFPPMDYIALGHIHQSQRVAKSENIRYSGSPISLSFDENKNQKSVVLVDFEKGQFKQATPLDIPCFQPMQVIKGRLKKIEKQLKKLAESSDEKTTWVEIIVSSNDYLNDLQSRIQKITNDSFIDVLRIRREKNTKPSALKSESKETLNELSVLDVFERRLNEEDWQSDADDKDRKERIKQCFKHVLNELEAEAKQ